MSFIFLVSGFQKWAKGAFINDVTQVDVTQVGGEGIGFLWQFDGHVHSQTIQMFDFQKPFSDAILQSEPRRTGPVLTFSNSG